MSTALKKIYFLPGTMCDERLWEELWQHLTPLISDDIELIHLPIPNINTIEEITTCLAKQLDKNSYVVGFSLGGYLASELVLNYPDKIAKLMLVSNMSSTLPTKENKERLRTISWISKHGYSGIPNKRINHLLAPIARNNQQIKNIICEMDETLGIKVLLHQLKVTTERKNLLPKLFTTACPIMFCVGETDCFVSLERIKAHLKESNSDDKVLRVIENTGHMLPLEQPNILANIISQWFYNQ